MRKLKKVIISSSENESATSINLETLTTLSEKLLMQAENFTVLSDAAASVFISLSVEKVDLDYFSKYKAGIPFGTLDKIKNAISEYKKQGLTPEGLAQLALGLEADERLKASDVSKIYEQYQKFCSEARAYEIGDLYHSLSLVKPENFGNHFRTIYSKVDLIIIDGFDEFTSPEIEILKKLDSVDGVRVFINLDYYEKNELLFAHLDNTHSKLVAFGFREVSGLTNGERSIFTDYFRKNFFNKLQPVTAPEFLDENIFSIEAIDFEEEVQFIASSIKTLITSECVNPSHIAVVFNNIDNYSQLLRSTFILNGIPFNLTDRLKLSNAQPVIAVLSFLEILENDFYYKSIAKALNSSFIDIDLNINSILNSASALKVTSGFKNWINSIDERIKYLKEIDDDYAVDEIIQNLKNAKSDLLRIDELLQPFKEKLNPIRFKEALFNLIQVLGINKTVLNLNDEFAEQNIKSVTLFVEMVNELFGLFQIYSNGEQKDFDYYLYQLRTACNWARYNTKERSDHGVLLTTVNEIRGLKFDYLFIGGLYDGNFPLKYNPEFFLSGDFRKKERNHQTEERFHFYQSLNAWEKRLTLSYPLFEGERQLSKSILLDELEQIVKIQEIDKKEYQSLIYNMKDYLLNFKSLSDHFQTQQPQLKTAITKILNINKIRLDSPFSDSVYNGFLISPYEIISGEAKETLAKLSDRTYSISQLESYAKCPMQFFLERILKLSNEEEPTEEFELTEIGLILHNTFFEFYSKITNEQIVLQNCNDSVFNYALEQIFEIAEEIYSQYGSQSISKFAAREKIFGMNGDYRDSILYKFLETERNEENGFVPSHFEVSFGGKTPGKNDELLSSENPLEVNDVKIRGKIDRIDLNEQKQEYSIVDYKLGLNKPTQQDLESGIALQIPIYMYATSKLLNERKNAKFEPHFPYIYSLKYDPDSFGKTVVKVSRKKLSDNEVYEMNYKLIETANEKIKEYVNSITSGRFNITQLENYKEKACKYCNFKTVCRVDELLD